MTTLTTMIQSLLAARRLVTRLGARLAELSSGGLVGTLYLGLGGVDDVDGRVGGGRGVYVFGVGVGVVRRGGVLRGEDAGVRSNCETQGA
jgi:hypothetical protein